MGSVAAPHALPQVLNANKQAGDPADGCPTYTKFSSGPCKNDRAVCNNHVVECLECKLVVWSYGTAAHYSAKHPQQRSFSSSPLSRRAARRPSKWQTWQRGCSSPS
jgi:hypothetical protein